MKKKFVYLWIVALCLIFSLPPSWAAVFDMGDPSSGGPSAGLPFSVEGKSPRVDFSRLPLYFMANSGQVDGRVRYYARASGYTLWVTGEGLVFDAVRPEGKAVEPGGRAAKSEMITRDMTRLSFVDAVETSEVVALEETGLRVNFFKGSDPSKWHSGVPTYRAVRYKGLYEGIDLKVYGLERQIEYDWIVAPGADPGRIRVEYAGADRMGIDGEGNLRIETAVGALIHKRPSSYQEIDGKRVVVASAYRKTGENAYGFEVGPYDRSRPLVIDPVVMTYGTFLGGTGTDFGRGVAVDGSGNAYIVGFTNSVDFPTLGPSPLNKEGTDVFVAGIDTNQTVMVKACLFPKADLTPSASFIRAGESVALIWVTSLADVVAITPDVGIVDGSSGSVTVWPKETMEYTVTATNACGAGFMTRWVGVCKAVPVITSFTATPGTIRKGESTKLVWEMASTERGAFTIVPDVEGTAYSNGGWYRRVSPEKTTTYTLTAMNACGEATAQTTVTVEKEEPPKFVINEFRATRSQILPGECTELSWKVTGAETVTITDLGAVDASGAEKVCPEATRTYLLRATGQNTKQPGNEITREVTIQVMNHVQVVPTLNEWGLMLMALLLGGVSVLSLGRRKVSRSK